MCEANNLIFYRLTDKAQAMLERADAFGRLWGLGTVSKVRWPSGLRRQLKALVRKGEGSNPSLIILFCANYIYITLLVFISSQIN